jgi:hypothetical protein
MITAMPLAVVSSSPIGSLITVTSIPTQSGPGIMARQTAGP